MDVQNTGPRALWRPMTWIDEVQVDGQWYARARKAPDRLRWFGPDCQQYGIRLVLKKLWRSTADGKPMALAAGKHTVRVAITAAPRTPSHGKPVRTVSNAVDVQTP